MLIENYVGYQVEELYKEKLLMHNFLKLFSPNGHSNTERMDHFVKKPRV